MRWLKDNHNDEMINTVGNR